MIVSFGDRATEDLFHRRETRRVRRFSSQLIRIALPKLDMINMAHHLDDLRSPPANRLKALQGNLKGSYSVRVNDQWRIVFRWSAGSAQDVSLTDYH